MKTLDKCIENHIVPASLSFIVITLVFTCYELYEELAFIF